MKVTTVPGLRLLSQLVVAPSGARGMVLGQSDVELSEEYHLTELPGELHSNLKVGSTVREPLRPTCHLDTASGH